MKALFTASIITMFPLVCGIALICCDRIRIMVSKFMEVR
jgi:hypothetical protein